MSSKRIGDYRLLARLGRGSLTDVFLATALGSAQRAELWVIKRLRREVVARSRDAAEAKRLVHPNLARTCEVGRHLDLPYHVQEYLEGQPLDRVLAIAGRSQGLPRRLALQLLCDLLSALDHAHGVGVAHGAIRPHNLFISYDGEVKLLDIAAPWLEPAALGSEAALYRALDQQDAAALPTPRADIFAVGLMLRACLAYEHPPAPDAQPTVHEQLAERPLRTLAQALPDLPPALVYTADQAVLCEPAAWTLSAADMRSRLIELAGDELENRAELKRLLGQWFEAELHQRAQRVAELGTSTPAVAQTAPTPAAFDFDDLHQTPSLSAIPTSAPRARVSTPPPPPPAARVSVSKAPPALPARPRSSQLQVPPAPPPRREDADSLMRLSIPRVDPAPSQAPGMAPGRQIARIVALLVPVAVLALAFWATRARGPATLAGSSASSAPAAVSGSADPLDRQRGPTARPAQPQATLRLCGSNTVGAELAPALVEAFLADKGGSDIARRRGADPESIDITANLAGQPLQVEIRAAGSATAFSGLAEGSCDVGMASRQVNGAETTLLRERGHGDLRSSATEHVIALDGIAVIVHPSNPHKTLDRAVLHDIFTGKVTDWSQLGDPAGAIQVLARDDKSGTYDTFKQLVLSGDPLIESAQRFASSEALSDGVASDPAAIGFVGFAYVRTARAVAVGEPGATPMLPSLFTVGTESYMLSRRLYLYTLPKPRVPWVTELVSFALSRRAQDVVAKNQFIGLGVSLQAAPCAEGCPEAYRQVVAGAERASLDFRFRTGSNEPDSRAGRDFERLVAYLAELRASKVLLLGFSDASGAGAVNEKLSLARAQAVEHELALRGVHAAQVRGFGAAMPVASNATEDGRQRNRRVEVWVVR